MMILLRQKGIFNILNSKFCPILISGNLRYYSQTSDRNFSKPPTFIATPIFYVNSVPHIGHLYTAVYADAIHRFSKLVNPDCEHIFSTGTDEHGLKIQRAAQAKNKDVLEYCDEFSNNFYQLFKSANINFTNFIRTTDTNHIKSVTSFWNLLMKNGFIYKSTYKGFYSVNDETFVPENLITTNTDGEKFSTESGHRVEWFEEENYMFRLSLLQDKLMDWIDNKLILKPDNFHSVLKADLQNIHNLRDISISRSKTRLQWGIEVPGDSSQVIYVWFDALVNYLVATGFPEHIKQWPPSHLIGKDILKFHAIYWPAFLIAAGFEPPNLIYCHSHWLYDDQKMSKSKGNVVDPFDCISQFTPDGIRFFLLKEGTPHSDSSFNMLKVKICLNADLANTFGNLLSRCTSLKLNPKQQFPRFTTDNLKLIVPEANEIIEMSRQLALKCYDAYLDGNFYIGISQTMDFLRLVNGFINITQPWSLVGSPNSQEKLDAILCVTLEAVRISAILLGPVMPHTSEMVLRKLNIEKDLQTWESAVNAFDDRIVANVALNEQKYVLFSKL